MIGAHSADFVWRAGRRRRQGASRAGGVAEVIALSYGERGESGELWKQEGQTVENVKRIRHAEAEARRRRTSAPSFRCLDFGDYPLQIDGERLLAIADAIREFAPDVLITHTDTDPFNPDHPVALRRRRPRARARRRRRRLQRASPRSSRRSCSCSSPTSPSCATSRRPCTSTSRRCGSRRSRRWREMQAQQYLQTYYAQRGEQRGNHARRASGDATVRYGESFQRVLPQVVEEL